MYKGAAPFIQNRKKVVAITYDRISHIIGYVVECYQKVLKDTPKYSKSYVKSSTTLSFEDYLKMEFVDKYLIPNKHLIFSKCSDLGDINFHYENQKRYIDPSDGKEKPDKIDIYINRLGLQENWNEQDEHIYFVIECKRIEHLSDCKKYVNDTQKFADRDYKVLRLPFEGQLAFIENKKLKHEKVAVEINKYLKAISSTLTTEQYLNGFSFHGTYTSVHRRNHTKKDIFGVYHLLFNYSDLLAP